ncbi:MAG: calcium-binding protein, partial [Pseudomonadota bacterium]
SAAGDLNGDGFDDLLIGAISTSPDADRYSVGSVYVVYGRQAYATEGDDLLIDSASANAINGMDGNDEIYGNGGNDILTGGNGRDWLDGGQGDDEMFGGLGNDTYVLDSNGDRASEYSGQGTDTVIAPFSIDLSDNAFVNIEHVILQAVEGDIGRALPGAELRGNDADNELIGNVGSDDLRGGDGKDTLIGLNGGDELRGQKNGDRLEGGNGSDDLRGGKGNDDLRGGKGGDDLRGERGNDDLMGGGGSDTLRGGYGQDDLTGNSGRDTFDFNDIAESGRNSKADTITDFERGKDVIDLKGIIGPTFDFIGTDKFDRGGDNQVRIDDQGRTVIVEIDIDDDRNSEMEIEVLDVGRLNASDFLL